MTFSIGFTGTQHGMTLDQGRQVLAILKDSHGIQYFGHGGCIGADIQAHKIARSLGISVRVWPPINKSKFAWDCMKDADRVEPADEYLLRNNKIAFFTDKLIATPRSREEEMRSGTWATVRYARKYRKHIYLILPDGSVREENAQ